MAAQWNTYFLEPLAIGGAGLLTAVVVDPVSLAPAGAIRAFLGPVAAVSEVDPNTALISVDLALQPTQVWNAHVWGAPRTTGQVISWFAKMAGVWVKGPIISAVDLTTKGTSDFPWVLDWLVDRLQEIAADRAFLPSKFLQIRRTYPRDITGWPMLSVQLDGLTPTGQFLGESEGIDGTSRTEGRIFMATLSIVGWTEKPEDRSRVGQWLMEALSIVLDVASHAGLSEPSFTLNESEDFETLGIPAFLVNASLTCQLESRRSLPTRSGYGHITV